MLCHSEANDSVMPLMNTTHDQNYDVVIPPDISTLYKYLVSLESVLEGECTLKMASTMIGLHSNPFFR